MSSNPSDFSVDPSAIPKLECLPNYWPATESGYGTSVPPMFREYTPAPKSVRSFSEDPNIGSSTVSWRGEMSAQNDDRNGHPTPINVDDDDESLFGGPSLGDDKGGNDAVAQDAESGSPVAVMIEDDDDLMILEPEDVPAHTKERFDKHKFGVKITPAADDELFVSPGPSAAGAEGIKLEETDDVTSLHHVPNNRDRASERSDEDSDTDYESDEYAQRSDGESSPKRRRRNKGKGKQKQVRKPEPMPQTQIRNATSQRRRVGDGEKTLQSRQPFQEPSDEELAQMFTEKERLSKLSRSGKLSLMDRMKLAAITAKIADLETLAQNIDSTSGADDAQPSDEEADPDADIEAALRAIEVLEEAGNAASSNNGVQQGSDFGSEEQQIEGSVKSKRKISAKTPKEWWERFYAEKEDNKSSAKGKKKQLAAARKKNKQSKGKKGITTAQEKRLMEMLKNSNPIVARAAHGDVVMPGPIDTRRQDDQLQAMKDFLLKMSGNPTKRHRSMEMGELKRSIRSFGRGKVKPSNGRWKVPGMESSLYNHQIVGVSWMLGQEFSPTAPFGGILADQMGLGKTVQVLATIVSNPPSEEDIKAGAHATLIIAPSAAIPQWIRELKKHCTKEAIGTWHHYRSHSMDDELWRKADILLASYTQVANALPSEKDLTRIAGMRLTDENWAKEFDKVQGDLLKFSYHRVVLDEAHAIRNPNTRTSKACINLVSKHRWLLTGTPFHNSIDELYPYMRFLNCHWATDPRDFQAQFGDLEKDTTKQRLEAVISSIMLRRRVDDTFLGAPILQIPKTHPIENCWVDLSVEERLIYNRLKSRFFDNIEMHIDASDKAKMRTYLACITRLRQAVSHPYLLEETMAKNFNKEDLIYLQNSLDKLGGRTPLHTQLQRWMTMEYEARIKQGDTAARFGQSQYGEYFDMDQQLAELQKKAAEEVNCRLCYDIATDAVITDPCGHMFCSDCIDGKLELDPGICPSCKNVLMSLEKLEQPVRQGQNSGQDAVLDVEDQPQPQRGRKRKYNKRPAENTVGQDMNGVEPRDTKEGSKWLSFWDENQHHPLAGSAKTVAIKSKILEWQYQAPEDKIIVFVQWVRLARILGRVLAQEGINFLYYFGSMTKDQRNKAVETFQDDPNAKVMAFGRVHRIGQEKETYFVRILTNNTIDENLMDLQKKKDGNISQIMQEDGIHREPPTLEELAQLFGNNNDDNNQAEAVEDNTIDE